MYPPHRRARERSPQPCRHRGVQVVNTQRTQSNSVHRIGSGHLQPGAADAAAGIGAHTAKNADRPGEPPRRERHHVHARRVDPLQVIDRHQQRPVVGEVFDDRQERRGHGALIGGRAVLRPQQHLVDRELAGVRAGPPTRMRAPRPAGRPGPCRPARIRLPRRAPTTPGNPCPVPAPRQPTRGWSCRCRARPRSATPMARKSQKPETQRSSPLYRTALHATPGTARRIPANGG